MFPCFWFQSSYLTLVCLKLILMNHSFDWDILVLVVTLRHLLVRKTNSSTGVKNLFQAKKPKMDQLFSLQQCFFGSLLLKVWAVFCSCQEEFGQRQTNTDKGVEVFLHCHSPLLSLRPAPFTPLERLHSQSLFLILSTKLSHRTVWVGRNVQRQSCPWGREGKLLLMTVPLHPSVTWTLKVPIALTCF